MTAIALDRDAYQVRLAAVAATLSRPRGVAADGDAASGSTVRTLSVWCTAPGFGRQGAQPAPGKAGPGGQSGGIPVHFYGGTAVIGPVARALPGRDSGWLASPCPACLATFWRQVRPPEVYDALESGGPVSVTGTSPYLTPFALEALAWVLQAIAARPARPGDAAAPVYFMNLATLAVRQVSLLPDPQCSACGGGRPLRERGRRAGEPAECPTVSVPKLAPDEFRQRRPGDYPLPIGALGNPVCGLLGRGVLCELAAPTTASATGITTVRDELEVRDTFWGGHALTYKDSLHVAFLEGLERYAGSSPRAGQPVIVASAQELASRGIAYVDPVQCGLYQDWYYRRYPMIAPYKPDQAIPWVTGYSLRDQRVVQVPEVLGFFGAGRIADRFVQECSNGCASGASITEAALHGLLELIERDAFLLTWFGRVPLPELAPASFGRSDILHQCDRLQLYGFGVRFFDATMTLPVPVIIATAVRGDGGLGALCVGAGASLDAGEAARGALIEIGTDAPAMRRRVGWRLPELRAMAADFELVSGLHDHPHLYGLPEMVRYASFLLGTAPGQRIARHPVQYLKPDADLRDDLRHCVEAVAAQGMDVVIVDHTIPAQRDYGVHSVQVIVPGLLPIDFGWHRQRALTMPRLRNALADCGYRSGPMDPADANPAPHPFP